MNAFARAVALHQAGDVAGAARLYRAVLAEAPRHLDALANLAMATGEPRLHALVLALAPTDAGLLLTFGSAMRSRGRADRAARAAGLAARLAPGEALPHGNRGNALLDLGRARAAARALTRAFALSPTAQALAALALALPPARAVPAYLDVVRRLPGAFPAWQNLGAALLELDRAEQAAEAYLAAARLAPERPEPLADLGGALRSLGRLTQAAAASRAALARAPERAVTWNGLGMVLKDAGSAARAADVFARALALEPSARAPRDNLLLTLQSLAEYDGPAILAATLATRPRAPTLPARPVTRHQGPIRVGYLSPDFRTHSCAYFLEALLTGHDPVVVTVHAYAELAGRDATTARLRGVTPLWRETRGLTDAALAALIAADGVDVLVDCAGLTAGGRASVMALRPAPVAMTWLGFPGPLGLPGVDYRLADPLTDPEDDHHDVPVIRLSGGFLAYRPPGMAPAPDRLEGPPAFGSFNNLAKVTPAVIDLWAAVMRAAPGAIMILKAGGLDDPPTRERLRSAFARRGVDPSRVHPMAWVPDPGGHLGLYRRVDVGLDSFPYNGTTTTFEALWMGVPVVTLAGHRQSARMGAAILTRAGLGHLVAADGEAYVAAAVAAIGRRERIRRAALAPLLDGARLARQMEAAYGRALDRAARGLPPAPIAVEDGAP